MKVHELCLTFHEYVDARLALFGQQVANFFQQHFLARWRSGRSLFFFLHVVHALDNHEHDKRHNDEGDDRGDEIAQFDDCGFFYHFTSRIHFSWRNRIGDGGEINAAHDGGEQGQEYALNESRYDRCERAAHDEAYGHVDQIAFQGELFEFLQHPYATFC